MNQRELFLKHVAQTSPAPLALEIVKAEGCNMWDAKGKEYIDLIAGISVCNVGHRHPKVLAAIQQQLDKYMHLIVYGEFVETPQVQYAKLLTDHLPASLNSVYFTNSGAEATEGAMKLAKRVTNRAEIVAFKNSYHGSTQGALSIMGDEYWRNAFRPLLPAVHHANYNSFEDLSLITTKTACVIAETIQAEAGVNAPTKEWMQVLRQRCTETGTLLILDEIQCGFGRNGTLWAFEQFDVVPDVLLLGKALGGGMPLGAFIANRELMWKFTENPVLGHISTFGGHPVCCAAGMAAMQVLLEEKLVDAVFEKEQLFRSLLQHPKVEAIRSRGLMMTLVFDSFETNKKVIDACIANSVITDWFLFAANCLRIAPPLTITKEEIKKACSVIVRCLDEL
ncbi:aspartate aminotransferase family protein [Lacibacter luteus]|uniref:Aspartate aminotransferase family protein n=1 Tax=Lacibacter luteus TaxID=2508719 RepID=A0A4Q1CIB9_9BACT|nr:aminotransferase class III-fold pyridoxal phosphate-dependent enzyme [Lacibacter luteus]RXK59875.1 aspartate aminotransferase family protein [Lacibacter luteus]